MKFERFKRYLLLVLLVTSVLTLAFRIRPVNADGRIAINADGTIDQPAPLIYNTTNTNYFFSSNIVDDNIFVYCRNIVLDGMGYTLSSSNPTSETGNGIVVAWDDDVIENMTITGFQIGVAITPYCKGTTINDNNITNSSLAGIYSYQGCTDTMICNNYVAENDNSGIFVTSNEFGTIANNTVDKNNKTIPHSTIGINIQASDYFYVEGNNITDNDYGLEINATQDSYIYHNNFVDNIHYQAIADSFLEACWDNSYPSGGNYWSDFAPGDSFNGFYQNHMGSDGIGDLDGTQGGLNPYVVNGPNRDNYPFTSESGWLISPISVQSNVTLTDMFTSPYNVTFTASGPSGQIGFINASMPVGLNLTNIQVNIDGVLANEPYTLPYQIITTNGTYYFVAVYFSLSVHNIAIIWGPLVLPGDFNGDGNVDLADLSQMILWYGMTSSNPNWNVASPPWVAPSAADYNSNHRIDLCDLVTLGMYYNLYNTQKQRELPSDRKL